MVRPGRLLDSEVEKLGLLLSAVTLGTNSTPTCIPVLGKGALQSASRIGLLTLPPLQRALSSLLLSLPLIKPHALRRRQLSRLFPVGLLLPMKVQRTLRVFRRRDRPHHSVSDRSRLCYA